MRAALVSLLTLRSNQAPSRRDQMTVLPETVLDVVRPQSLFPCTLARISVHVRRQQIAYVQGARVSTICSEEPLPSHSVFEVSQEKRKISAYQMKEIGNEGSEDLSKSEVGILWDI